MAITQVLVEHTQEWLTRMMSHRLWITYWLGVYTD